VEKTKKCVEHWHLQWHALYIGLASFQDLVCDALTIGFWSIMINCRARNQNIVNDGKHTFATNPSAVLMLNATVIQDGGFVKLNTSLVNLLGKDNFVLVEVVPTGLTLDLVRKISQDVFDRVRTELDASLRRQICFVSALL
jgi:hypothetical protein